MTPADLRQLARDLAEHEAALPDPADGRSPREVEARKEARREVAGWRNAIWQASNDLANGGRALPELRSWRDRLIEASGDLEERLVEARAQVATIADPPSRRPAERLVEELVEALVSVDHYRCAGRCQWIGRESECAVEGEDGGRWLACPECGGDLRPPGFDHVGGIGRTIPKPLQEALPGVDWRGAVGLHQTEKRIEAAEGQVAKILARVEGTIQEAQEALEEAQEEAAA